MRARVGGQGSKQSFGALHFLSLEIYNLLVSFADSFKIQYMQFMAYMKTPQYKASLQQLLEQEKVGVFCRF